MKPSWTGPKLPPPPEPCPKSATLAELRKAVGSWPWRLDAIRASSSKPISEEMTLLMALVTFGGFELFPKHDHPGPKAHRHV